MPEPASRPRPDRTPIRIVVDAVSQLSHSLVRVRFVGDEWERFGEPVHADSYVKLLFLADGVHYDEPIDQARIREQYPPEHWPKVRTYTVREFDRSAGAMTIDFVVHGDEGVAGPWAAGAEPGDVLHLLGPGGGYTPDATADWHLMAGDESALPAIAAALERVPCEAAVTVLVEVEGREDEIPLATTDRTHVHWLHRGDRPVGDLLAEALENWTTPDGTGQYFVHGEAGAVKEIRRELRVNRDVPLAQMSISGYWRLGADDEKWREVKRAWNKAIDDSETDRVAAAS